MKQFVIDNCGNIALLGFFLAFVLIVINVMRPGKKAELESHAQIPLQERE